MVLGGEGGKRSQEPEHAQFKHAFGRRFGHPLGKQPTQLVATAPAIVAPAFGARQNLLGGPQVRDAPLVEDPSQERPFQVASQIHDGAGRRRYLHAPLGQDVAWVEVLHTMQHGSSRTVPGTGHRHLFPGWCGLKAGADEIHRLPGLVAPTRQEVTVASSRTPVWLERCSSCQYLDPCPS